MFWVDDNDNNDDHLCLFGTLEASTLSELTELCIELFRVNVVTVLILEKPNGKREMRRKKEIIKIRKK